MKIFANALFLILIFVWFASSIITPSATQAQGWIQGQEMIGSSNTGLSNLTPIQLIMSILYWLLSLVFFSTVLAFVASGVMFIMSFGNRDLADKARSWITYAIIGLAVSVLGYAVVITISKVLVGESGSGDLNFWWYSWSY